jgi:hypothetical protein
MKKLDAVLDFLASARGIAFVIAILTAIVIIGGR